MDERLRQIVSSTLGVEAVDETMSSDTFDGWDSQMHLQLIFNIEQAFDIRFEFHEIIEMTSVAKLQDYLQQRCLIT